MTNNIPREWAAYVRVSKVGDRDGDSFHSPRQQEDECRRAAPGRVVTVFKDLDQTGTRFDREGLNAALAWLRADPASRGLIAYDTSRLGRNTREVLTLIDTIEAQGAAVATAHEKIDTVSPEGRMALTMWAGMAEFYSRSMSRRWRSVHTRRLDAGRPSSGQPRFGYTKDATGRFVPDPVTAPVLRDLYQAVLRGESAKAVVTRLNEQGHRMTRGGEFTVVNLWRLLDNGFAAGLLRHDDGTWRQGAHEALIDETTWAAYQRRREARKRVGPRSRGATVMLTGLVYCGLCGSRMYMNSVSAGKYRCGAYVQKGTCSGVSVLRHRLESEVALWLGGHVDVLTRHASEGRERSEERARVLALVESSRTEHERLEEALTRLTLDYAEGFVSRGAFAPAQADLSGRIAAARQRAIDAEAELDTLGDLPVDLYERLVAVTEGMGVPEFNHTLQKIVREVRVHKRGVEIVPLTGDPVYRAR